MKAPEKRVLAEALQVHKEVATLVLHLLNLVGVPIGGMRISHPDTASFLHCSAPVR